LTSANSANTNKYRDYSSMVIYGGESVYVNVALKLPEIKF